MPGTTAEALRARTEDTDLRGQAMHSSQIAADILSGVLIGLSIAVPVGPSCLLCIQRCLAGGPSTGLATGLGISTVHAVYAALALRGSSEIVLFVGIHADAFTIASVCLLFLFAARALRSVPRIEGAGQAAACPARSRPRFGTSYASALLLGSTNPMTVLFFLAVMPSFSALLGRPLGSEGPWWVVCGVAAGSFAWWSTVVGAVRFASRHLLDERRLRVVNRASALSLALVGLAFLMPVLKGWVADHPHRPAVIVRDGMSKGGDWSPDLPSRAMLTASR